VQVPAAENELVSFVCPAPIVPNALTDGHMVCEGWGSEAISWPRVSLFTNVTLCEVEMDTDEGLIAPFAPIVIVAPLGPGPPPPDGIVGGPPLSPHAISDASAAATTACRQMLDPRYFTVVP
jgi:hypothetical protein